jgi:hypothetical protein
MRRLGIEVLNEDIRVSRGAIKTEGESRKIFAEHCFLLAVVWFRLEWAE